MLARERHINKMFESQVNVKQDGVQLPTVPNGAVAEMEHLVKYIK